MSLHAKLGFTAVLFIASIGTAVAQDATPLDFVASYPPITNPVGAQPAARGPQRAAADPRGLAENSYDFTNPDSIPGFGTLPPSYDSRRVMPLIGSE